MASFTGVVNEAILASYDFSPIGKIIDVGGGDGSLIVSILKVYPRVRGVLFDLPHVIAGAKRRIEAEGLAERCEVVAGDFLSRCLGVGMPTC
jgi:16S rRNA G1207 methylase RsmC